MESTTGSAQYDRVWAATASALVGAVMAIGRGIHGLGGWVAVVSVLALGALAFMEARSPAKVQGWMRVIPFGLLLVAAISIMWERV